MTLSTMTLSIITRLKDTQHIETQYDTASRQLAGHSHHNNSKHTCHSAQWLNGFNSDHLFWGINKLSGIYVGKVLS